MVSVAHGHAADAVLLSELHGTVDAGGRVLGPAAKTTLADALLDLVAARLR